jgi:hypothetical protein
MLKRRKSKLWFIFIAYSIMAITVSTQNFLIKGKHDRDGSLTSKYGNYLIFKYSYYHLIQDKDLYQKYPEVCGDLYKYSPTFAMAFGVFSYFPDFMGLTLWNLLNVLLIFFAVANLSKFNIRQQSLILIFIIIELITSIQNSQSNGLITGLLVFAFVLLEQKKFFLATLCIILTMFIKIFGVVVLLLFLFYPDKKKLAAYSFFWFILLLIMPVVLVGPDQLLFLYKSWFKILSDDQSVSLGLSVSGWLQSLFKSASIHNNYVLITGFLMLTVPFLRIGQYRNDQFRLLTLSSILIWAVIFNHKAESPTFIIAMTGVALWYFSQQKTVTNLILLIIAFTITSLLSTDLVPVRNWKYIIDEYCIKAVPCILIWIKIFLELMTRRFDLQTGPASDFQKQITNQI